MGSHGEERSAFRGVHGGTSPSHCQPCGSAFALCVPHQGAVDNGVRACLQDPAGQRRRPPWSRRRSKEPQPPVGPYPMKRPPACLRPLLGIHRRQWWETRDGPSAPRAQPSNRLPWMARTDMVRAAVCCQGVTTCSTTCQGRAEPAVSPYADAEA